MSNFLTSTEILNRVYSGNTLIGFSSDAEILNAVFDETQSSLRINVSGGTSSGTYNSTLDPSLEVLTAVGGITAGTSVGDLLGNTFTQLFDSLLFPTVFPNYIAPSSTFSKDVSTLQTIGDDIDILFTNTFNRGQIRINTTFQDHRAGVANSYNYGGTGLTTPSALATQTLSSWTVVQGNTNWTGSVNYDEGPQPQDSTGTDYGTPLAAGSTTNATQTVEGVYPLFATTSNIITPSSQPLQSMITGNNIQFNLVSESGGNKQKFEIPTTWLSSRALTNVLTYNSVSGTWDPTGLGQWTTSVVTNTIEGNVINYTRYTFNGSDRSSVQIRIVF